MTREPNLPAPCKERTASAGTRQASVAADPRGRLPTPRATAARRLSQGRWLLLILGFVALSMSMGCTRAFYRRQADQEVNCLVDEKSMELGQTPGEYRIAIDPRSRMYDPFDPDSPPMPPDDPVSNQLMFCVDCKPGSPCWRCAARSAIIENPTWQQYLPRNEEGRVVLDIPSAVQVALLESTDYQQELEDLYLSALDVSFERFRFDTQFFGGSSIFFDATGRERAGGSASSVLDVSPFRSGNRLQLRKLSATGGELVVGLANSLVWQFAGSDNYTSRTLLDFALVQPLLRAGGRTRVLERLTITERALLSNIRIMERFRRGFYVNVVTGRNPGQGPSRRGGVFGGGLEGFTGVGGGFGGVGGGGGGGAGLIGLGGGAGAAGAGGYMGLLQSAQVIRNQQVNVAALRDNVAQLQAASEAGRIDRFQVELARQALYNAQSQLLNLENAYQQSLESFLVDFGLPPELDVVIQDPLLERFNLIPPELSELQEAVAETLNELRTVGDQGLAGGAAEPGAGGAVTVLPVITSVELADSESVSQISFDSPAESDSDMPGNTGPILLAQNDQTQQPDLPQLLARSVELAEAALGRIASAEQDLVDLEAALPQRRENLQSLAGRPEVQSASLDPVLFSVEQLEARAQEVTNEVQRLRGVLDQSVQEVRRIQADISLTPEQQASQMVDALVALSSQLLELTIVQARARLDGITFDPIDLEPQEALQIASAYRQDWMNARAALVDSWRLIFFNANDLLSDLDVTFSGDIGNVGDNPFRLRGTDGRLSVGLAFDAPLTRLSERNAYRQSLIEYQQSRRAYYQYRDQVYQSLRNTLRQLRLNEVNFEIRRAAVQVAITQVDITQLRLQQPPAPGVTEQFGNTTARDLVQSLSDLLNVQNDFLSVWVNYEVQRLSLDFDLGIMELDPYGLRIEHGVPLETYLANARGMSCDLWPETELLQDGEVIYAEPVGPGGFGEVMTGDVLTGDVQADPSELPVPADAGGLPVFPEEGPAGAPPIEFQPASPIDTLPELAPLGVEFGSIGPALIHGRDSPSGNLRDQQVGPAAYVRPVGAGYANAGQSGDAASTRRLPAVPTFTAGN